MAKKLTKLEKVLADINDQIALLERSKAPILRAIAEDAEKRAAKVSTTVGTVNSGNVVMVNGNAAR